MDFDTDDHKLGISECLKVDFCGGDYHCNIKISIGTVDMFSNRFISLLSVNEHCEI